MASPFDLVRACRVPETVQPARAGLWEICRMSLDDMPGDPYSLTYQLFEHTLGSRIAPFRSITMLFRDTMATLHRDRGECVMEDSPEELRRHLPILLAARGRVLVSGLGLGCVVRGLLAKPEVEHVDVVEISYSILQLASAEFADDPRVTIHHGDALTIEWPARTRWEYAWHDVWSEQEALALVHARLFARYQQMCNKQGAWMMPRAATRRMPRSIIGGPRRRQVAVANA
jgi:hypothetical protein